MTALWTWWVRRVERPIDARPYVLLKRLLAAVLMIDLLAIPLFGAWDAVLFTAEHGGIIKHAQPWALTDAVWAGPLWWTTSLVLLAAVASGRGGRWVLLLAVVTLAQLGHLDWSGDRAIDRICRTALLLLAFSNAGRAEVPSHIRGWIGDLIRILLVAIYVDAAFAKLGGWSWMDPEFNPLYTILTGPQVGRLDPAWFFPYQPLFAVLGGATLCLEFTSPAILVRRLAPFWAIGGAALHLGLALTMDLGIFPYAMLCFYVVLFESWWLPRTDASASSS